MENPYKTLGLKETATDAEIKAAYYDAVRKYHPDQYTNNPLSDLAEEKLKEINEAYDTIQKQRQTGQRQYSNTDYSQSGNTGGHNSAYATIRAKINAGDYAGAEAMLRSMPSKDAEWYFLMGMIYRMKGWHEEAERCFQKSCTMNPGNQEYARAYQETTNRAGYYQNTSTRNTRSDSGLCNCLGNLCLADCCCECMGGDLIPCC